MTKQNFYRFLGSLFLIDLVVVALHLWLGGNQLLFNLDAEMNFPTIYQALKLISVGIIVLIASKNCNRQNNNLEFFIQGFSVALIGIGFDELFQIHENIYRVFEFIPFLDPANVVTISYNLGFRSSLWLLYYLPIFVIGIIWLSYWVRQLLIIDKRTVWMLGVSIFLIGVVLIAEFYSSTGIYTLPTHNLLILIEETAELLAGSLLAFLLFRLIVKSSN